MRIFIKNKCKFCEISIQFNIFTLEKKTINKYIMEIQCWNQLYFISMNIMKYYTSINISCKLIHKMYTRIILLTIKHTYIYIIEKVYEKYILKQFQTTA